VEGVDVGDRVGGRGSGVGVGGWGRWGWFTVGGAGPVGLAGERRVDGVGVGVHGKPEQRAEDVAERVGGGAGLGE
jgi:hypothetical protein